jgi:hypothetical protein
VTRRAAGHGHNDALGRLANRLVGIPHRCLKTRTGRGAERLAAALGRSRACCGTAPRVHLEAAAEAFASLWVADVHWAADGLTRKLLGLMAEGEDRGLDAILEAEFGEDAADVGLDGLFADRQVPGDLPVAVTAGDQPEHVAFTR